MEWNGSGGDRLPGPSAGEVVDVNVAKRFARSQLGRGKRRRSGALILLIVTVLALGSGALPASAHAVLLRSDPPQNARLAASPKLVDLFFSEPLDHSFSTVQVRDTSGARQDKGAVHFSSDPTEMSVETPALAPGFYTVTWTTLSAADGHKLEGTFPFTVLNPDGTAPSGTPPPATVAGGGATGVQPFDAAVRWILLCGLIGVAGGFAFFLLVLYPAAASVAPEQRRHARAVALRLLGLIVPIAAAVVVCVNLIVLTRQAVQNGSLGMIPHLFSGSVGVNWIVRELFALAAGLLAWWLARRRAAPEGTTTVLAAGCGLTFALICLLTMSLTSHAAAGTGSAWAVPSDLLHLTGVSLWLGCLFQLPVLLRSGWAGATQRSRFLGTALQRFSILAVCSVGLVLLTGTFNALVQLPSFGALTDTAYGRALLVKLALIVPLLAFGLLNAVRIARRLERQSLAADSAAEHQAHRLVRSAVLESIAGAVVIATTAVMVFLVPSKDAVAQGSGRQAAVHSAPVSSVYRNQAPAGDLTASLTVSPNRVGENDFRVLLTGPGVDQAQRVQLRFQFAGQGVGGSTVDADPVAGTPGLFAARAANFSFVGNWRVTVNVRRTGADDVNGAFAVEVPDVTGATTSTGFIASRSATRFPAHGVTEQQAWGIMLVAAGGLLFVFRRRVWNVNPYAGTAGVFGIAGAVIVGVAVVLGGRSHATLGALLQNPVPADERSVAAGKALFAANCAVCHGSTGHGDGPQAAALNPKPLDLTVHAGLHPDSQLYDWITNGILRSAMPAWKGQLTDQQRWDLVNYLRTLSSGADASPASLPPLAP